MDLLEETKGKNIQAIVSKFQNHHQTIEAHCLKHKHKVWMVYERLIQKFRHQRIG